VVDVHDVIMIGRLRSGEIDWAEGSPVHVARDLTPAQIRGQFFENVCHFMPKQAP
jgi:hypothetical protein